MSITWNSVDWLERNYSTNNGLPGFFIQGQYPITYRLQAELDYRRTVQVLSYCDVEDCKSWALRTIESDYMTLKSQDGFWYSTTLRGNVINELLAAETSRFIMSSPADFQSTPKRRLSRSEEMEQASPRRRISIEEHDNIFISGLNQSLFSYLKSNAASDYLYKYHDVATKDQCRVTAIMNDVIDVNDIVQNEEWYKLNKDQSDIISSMYNHVVEFSRIDENTSIYNILHSAHKNWSKAVYQLIKKTRRDSPEKIATYTISWHLSNLHMEKFNVFDREEMLSEGDFVVKVWGPIFETLFRQTSVLLHWGDTLSQTNEENGDSSRRRMDLRFLCSSKVFNDVGDIEFGKKACVTKLYYDKEKLITNGKLQLNEIIKLHDGGAHEINLCLVQVLGFEAEIYKMSMVKNGVYILNKLKRFSVPVVASRLKNDCQEFFEGLSIIREMIIHLSVLCNDSLKKKGRMNRVSWDKKPSSIAANKPSWCTSLWIPPSKPPKLPRPTKTTL